MPKVDFFDHLISPNTLAEIFDPRLRQADHQFSLLVSQIATINPLQPPSNLHLTLNGQTLIQERSVSGQDIFMFHYDPVDHDGRYLPLIVPYRPKRLIPNHSFCIFLLPELNEDGSQIDLGIGLIKRAQNRYYTGWSDSHFPLSARRQHHNKPYIYLVQHVYYQSEDYLDAAWRQLQLNKEYGAMYLLR